MRMAGAWYIDSNGKPVGKSRLIDVTGDRYPAELFEVLLPKLAITPRQEVPLQQMRPVSAADR